MGDDVSSHADTIRGELLGDPPYGTFESAAKAYVALDALLAENQRIRDENKRLKKIEAAAREVVEARKALAAATE